MTLLAALAGSLTVIGLWLIARGLRPQPQTPPPPARPRVSLVSRIASMKRATRIRLAIATLIGIAAALVTGWVEVRTCPRAPRAAGSSPPLPRSHPAVETPSRTTIRVRGGAR